MSLILIARKLFKVSVDWTGFGKQLFTLSPVKGEERASTSYFKVERAPEKTIRVSKYLF